MKTLEEAILELSQSDWITIEHQVAIISLLNMARQLDEQALTNKIHAPLMSAFGLAYRNLLKERPSDHEEVDELEKLLKR
jgi:hypothetical protein